MIGLALAGNDAMDMATATNCPKCNAHIGASVDTCPQCGILFNKWQERENNVASGNMGRYSIANATSSEFNWVILVLVATIVAAVFYFLWYNQ